MSLSKPAIDMPILSNPIDRQTLLNDFARKQRDKTIAFLRKSYSLSEDDCEDIFQDSFIILYNNIKEGKLDNLTSSISTYLMAICKNKAMELLRNRGKYISVSVNFSDGNNITFSNEKVDTILALDTDESATVEEKEALVRKIVHNLPSPCDELLWGFYRDGLPMKDLANKFNYASENAVKVTKHRCCEKFRRKFNEILNNLF